MGDDEAGGSYRPYHVKPSPLTFSGNTTEFLSFEAKFLRYAKRHDLIIVLLKEREIRL